MDLKFYMKMLLIASGHIKHNVPIPVSLYKINVSLLFILTGLSKEKENVILSFETVKTIVY